MKPIAARLLPQTVTLYNLFKDPDSGATSRRRTVLERVRIATFKNTTMFGETGPRTRFSLGALIDPVTTVAWAMSGGAKTAKKTYSPPSEWRRLDPEAKDGRWTLAGLDWLCAVVGARETIGPDFGADDDDQAFRLANDVKVITEVVPTIDKDGSVHHWEVFLD